MAFLNKTTQGNAAAQRTMIDEKEKIVWLDARELVRNERNFYGLRDIEKLAALIAASSVVEPLTVTPTGDGKYRIVSGERRTAATLMRLERGDIIDPKLPCIVKTFEPTGALEAEDMEMLCLIASNRGQRQQRTALERLTEIQELEPIAKKIFQNENIHGSFRRFFAEEILSISSAQLQRLKMLTKLVDEGRAALELGMISETAAVTLASYTKDEQNAYLKALVNDSIRNRVEDIQAFFESVPLEDNNAETSETVEMDDSAENLSNDAEEETAGDEENANPHSDEDEQEEAPEDESESVLQSETETTINAPKTEAPKPPIKSEPARSAKRTTSIDVDLPIPADLTPDKAEREADTWIIAILTDSVKIAEQKVKDARAAGDTRTAALWDFRRAKAELVLATVRD